jgi:hypothetical protein
MSRRVRVFVLVATAVLLVGLGTAGVASYVGLGQLLGVESSDEFSYVPTDADLVAFADVRQLMDSEIGRALQDRLMPASGSPNPLSQAGIDIRTDVDTMVAAVLSKAGMAGGPLLIARGRFDFSKIESVVLSRGGDVNQYEGTRVVTLGEPALALAFIDVNLVAAGQLDLVKRALDTRAAGSGSVRDNPEVMRLADRFGDSNAWVISRFDALRERGQVPTGLVGQLPAITWLAAGGRVSDGVSGELHAETRDDQAARDLRDVIRGLLALVHIQAGQSTELAEIVNSIELAGEGTTVSVSFSVPPATIEKLGAIAPRLREPASGVSLDGSRARTPRRRAPVI